MSRPVRALLLGYFFWPTGKADGPLVTTSQVITTPPSFDWLQQGQCPNSMFEVPSPYGVQKNEEWACCSNCPLNKCYDDCGCLCTTAQRCEQLGRNLCRPGLPCYWDGQQCAAVQNPTPLPSTARVVEIGSSDTSPKCRWANHRHTWCRCHDTHPGLFSPSRSTPW